MAKATVQSADKEQVAKEKQGILHIRIDQGLLDESQSLAKELGFNLSTHVRVLLRKALDERKKGK